MVITSIMKRIHIIRAKLLQDRNLTWSLWGDVAHETFKFYGRHKAAIQKEMTVDSIDGMLRVEVAGRVIYWPEEADVTRLVDMYFEVFNEQNNHCFDIAEMKVKTGDVVIDCGACEGYFTLKALESGAAKVYCIEPGTAIVGCLGKTFADEIQSGKVFVHRCLVGEKNSSVEFYDNPSDPTLCQIRSSSGSVPQNEIVTQVQMLTIDEFCRQQCIGKVDFIKADVEGGETGLIRGAESIIRRYRPKLAIAVYHAPENANIIVDFVKSLSLGYTIRVKGIVEFDGIPRPVMVHCYHNNSLRSIV